MENKEEKVNEESKASKEQTEWLGEEVFEVKENPKDKKHGSIWLLFGIALCVIAIFASVFLYIYFAQGSYMATESYIVKEPYYVEEVSTKTFFKWSYQNESTLVLIPNSYDISSLIEYGLEDNLVFIEVRENVTKYQDVPRERKVIKKASLIKIWTGQVDWWYESN